MRRFGKYWTWHSKGNEEAEDIVRKIIKINNLNFGLDNKDKVYLVADEYLKKSISAIKQIPGEMGFFCNLGMLAGIREREFTYAYKADICRRQDGCDCDLLHTAEKLNGKLTVVVLNRLRFQEGLLYDIANKDVE
jgi:hypothetical protein